MPNSSRPPGRTRPPASISLDLDDLWAYLKTHGDAKWTTMPSFLSIAIPRVIEFFRQRGHGISVFVVGRDATAPANGPLLGSLAEAGHEIGNHSFHHEPWLHRYPEDRLVEEIERTEEAVYLATGQKPCGFRGPGFSCPPALLAILARRDYCYDASTFPTFLGPVARAWYFWNSRFNSREKEDRHQLFGRFVDGLQSVKPYYWQIGDRRLLEIPVTTMPIVKLPIHASYLNWLARFSPLAARTWFRSALQACYITGSAPSLLLHALDFLDDSDCPEMAFFPGVTFPLPQKLALINRCLDMIERHWQPGTMLEHARWCADRKLNTRQLSATVSGPTVQPVEALQPLQSTCKPS